jgi:stage III sporulation protein AH
MFKIKRPAIIGILVVLLVFTGYLQHQLTQQAQLKSSKDYQNHEMLELVNNNNEEDDLVQDDTVKSDLVVDTEEKIDVIDSAKSDKDQSLETMYTEASISAKNYFVEYRLSRDKLRASLVDRLDEIINNVNTTEIIRTDAQKEIMEIGNNSEVELQIEGLIKAKGYDDAIVFLTDKDIKIVVSALELGEQDMVKILDIIKSETEYDTNNIKIMKKQ